MVTIKAIRDIAAIKVVVDPSDLDSLAEESITILLIKAGADMAVVTEVATESNATFLYQGL